MSRCAVVLMLAWAAPASAHPGYDVTGQSPLAGGVFTGDIDLNGHLLLNMVNAASDGTAAGGMGFAGQVRALSFNGSTDGVVLFVNAAASGFTKLQLGGTTGSFGAICQTGGGGLLVELANGTCANSDTLGGVTASALATYNGGNRKALYNINGVDMTSDGYFQFRNNVDLNSGSGDVGGTRSAAGAMCLTSGGTTCTGSLGALTSRKSGTATNITNTLATTGLAVPVVSGVTYQVSALLMFNNSTANEGAKFDFNGGTAPTMTDLRIECEIEEIGQTAFDTVVEATAVSTSLAKTALVGTGSAFLRCNGMITPSSTATLTMQFAESAAHVSGTLTLQRGSYLRAEPMP